MRYEPADWLRPAEAVVLISPLVGGDDAARAMLTHRLRDRTVRACCFYITQAYDFGKVPSVFVDPVPDRVCDADTQVLPVERNLPTVHETNRGTSFVFWESGRPPEFGIIGSCESLTANWDSDVARWNWADGVFAFRRPPLVVSSNASKQFGPRFRYPIRTVFYGVKFSARDIQEIEAGFKPPAVAVAPPLKKARRQARKSDWAEINMQLVAVAYQRDLDEVLGVSFEQPGWHATLRDWIEGRLDTMNIHCDSTVIDDEIARFREAMVLERAGAYAEQDEAVRRKLR